MQHLHHHAMARNPKWPPGDIEAMQCHAIAYPMIGDPELKVAKLYDMLPADAGDSANGRTATDNATVRSRLRDRA